MLSIKRKACGNARIIEYFEAIFAHIEWHTHNSEASVLGLHFNLLPLTKLNQAVGLHNAWNYYTGKLGKTRDFHTK